MKNKILLGVSFIACFGLGFVCGMYAQSKIIAGNVAVCSDGGAPDKHGCCPGEVYTDMADQGFACCPTDGGDCFPPID